MIDKIIWKVFFMIGGIAGSIFSIVNLSKSVEEMNYYESWVRSDSSYSAKANDAAGHAFLWAVVLVVSIIIFIVGCVIKAEQNKSK